MAMRRPSRPPGQARVVRSVVGVRRLEAERLSRWCAVVGKLQIEAEAQVVPRRHLPEHGKGLRAGLAHFEVAGPQLVGLGVAHTAA